MRWLRVAADRALEAAAFEDAARHLDAALELEAGLDDAAQADLRFALGVAQRGAGRWEDALATWMDTLGRYRALGDREQQAQVAWHVGYQLLWAGREADLATVLSEALVDLEGTEIVSHARLLIGAAVGFATVGQLGGVEVMLAKAEAMAANLDDDGLDRDLDQARAVVHWTFPGLRESIDAGRRGEARMEAAGALWDLANVRSFITAAQRLAGRSTRPRPGSTDPGAGRPSRARRRAHLREPRLDPTLAQTQRRREGAPGPMEAEAALAHDGGIGWAESNAVWHCAIAELWLGRWDEALVRGRDGMTRKIPAGYAGGESGVLAWSSPGTVGTRGGPGGIEPLPARSRRRVSERRSAPGCCSCSDGRPGPGRRVGPARLPGAGPGRPPGHRHRLPRRRHRPVEVARGLDGRRRGPRGHANGVRGGDREADRRGFRIEEAEARRLYALALDRLGADGERASAMRAEAAERYRELGMDRHAALCER